VPKLLAHRELGGSERAKEADAGSEQGRQRTLNAIVGRARALGGLVLRGAVDHQILAVLRRLKSLSTDSDTFSAVPPARMEAPRGTTLYRRPSLFWIWTLVDLRSGVRAWSDSKWGRAQQLREGG
jgi:hypothetical protein